MPVMQIKSTEQIIKKKTKKKKQSVTDNKCITILLKGIDINQCSKKLTGFLLIKQENGFK